MTRVGDVLKLVRRPIEPANDSIYTNIGVRSFGKGIFHYPACPGSELSKLRFYRFPVSSLVVSNIKAWEGAVAMTSEADSDCIASNRFLFYVTKNDKVDLRYVFHFLLSDAGRRALISASPGAVDRNRTLGIKAFEDIQLELPDHEEQIKLADTLEKRLNHIRRARELLYEQEQLLDKLRYSFLDKAFPGNEVAAPM